MKTTTMALALSIGLMTLPMYGDTINVSLDTSPLIGHLAGPFFLEFQFNDGSGASDGNNTFVLSGFTFGAGGAVGMPTLIGGTTGNLPAGFNLTDSSFFNQVIQGFTPGSSLAFQLSLTTNVDPGGTPDEFSFAILDSSGFEIPTSGPANALLLIDIDSTSPTTRVFAADATMSPSGGGDPINMAAPIASSSVPEPGTLGLVAAVLAAAFAIRRLNGRRQRD